MIMKIGLYPFQKKARTKIHSEIRKAVNEYNIDKSQQIISYTAPTGSGKTIIMTSTIEDVLFGDEEGVFIEKPDSIIVWLSDSPELNKQSLDKMLVKSDKLRVNQMVIIEDSSFHDDILEDGKIYFLNTQKLAKGNGLVKYSDTRQRTIWDVLTKTIEEKGDKLLLVIDEAHRGTSPNTKDAGKATSIMQKFIKGSEEDGLLPFPIVIGMSATIKRFELLVKGIGSTRRPVETTPDEVRESGLLKDKIYATYPDKDNSDMAVLQAATDNWKDKYDRWKMFTDEQHIAKVNPILLVQVKNGNSETVSTSNLDECLMIIEDRLGYRFKEGEVVHAFGDCDEITMNGLLVKKCEASKVNDDMKIKVVFFKDALSTGWDCPRAETMVSFRPAKEYTYIAQVLGRIIRTPLGRRISVDEELNNVHIYLTDFDTKTVENIIKYLNENENGDIAVDFESRSVSDEKKHEVLTVNYDEDDDTNEEPDENEVFEPVVEPETKSETPVSTETKPVDTPVVKECETTEPIHEDAQPKKETPKETVETPFEKAVKNAENGVEEPVNNVVTDKPKMNNRKEILKFINEAGVPTYNIMPKSRRKPLPSLFDIVDLITMSGFDFDLRDNIYADIVQMIEEYISTLKDKGEYDNAVSEVKNFNLSTKEFDTINLSVNTIDDLINSISTDADLDRKLRQASRVLQSEEIATKYGKSHIDTYKVDVIIFANSEVCLTKLDKYATSKFNELAEKYRRRVAKELSEKEQSRWHNIVKDGNPISKDNFSVPSSAEIPTDVDGKEYPKHLLIRKNGEAPKFKMTSWEEKTIEVEREREDFQCWLRNPPRKNWSLCIPYKMNGEYAGMYPDFIVIRKEDDDYVFDILEPHRSDAKDNFNKAQGLAEYANNIKDEPIGRIQLIRVIDNKLVRLDFMKKEMRDRVLKATSIADIDNIFDELSKE